VSDISGIYRVATKAGFVFAVIDAYMESAKKRRMGLSSRSPKKKKSQTDDFVHQKMVSTECILLLWLECQQEVLNT
jgi:hypothetical protein